MSWRSIGCWLLTAIAILTGSSPISAYEIVYEGTSTSPFHRIPAEPSGEKKYFSFINGTEEPITIEVVGTSCEYAEATVNEPRVRPRGIAHIRISFKEQRDEETVVKLAIHRGGTGDNPKLISVAVTSEQPLKVEFQEIDEPLSYWDPESVCPLFDLLDLETNQILDFRFTAATLKSINRKLEEETSCEGVAVSPQELLGAPLEKPLLFKKDSLLFFLFPQMHKSETLVRPHTVPITLLLDESSKSKILAEFNAIPENERVPGFPRERMLQNGRISFLFITGGNYMPAQPPRFFNQLNFAYSFYLAEVLESDSLQIQLPGGLPRHVSLSIRVHRFIDTTKVWGGSLPTSRSKSLLVDIKDGDHTTSRAEDVAGE